VEPSAIKKSSEPSALKSPAGATELRRFDPETINLALPVELSRSKITEFVNEDAWP